MIVLWVFHGEGGRFASGVFITIDRAKEWISKHNLSGILTAYPVDKGCYDWAIEEGYFEVKKDDQTTPEYIGKFTSASQEHYHFENGMED